MSSKKAKKPSGDYYRIPSPSTPLARSRYLRHVRDKMTIEEIAAQDGVSIAPVKCAIQQAKLYYQLSTTDEAAASELNIILATQKAQKDALLGALKAKRPITNRQGAIIEWMDDYITRMEAVGRINEKLEALQPRGKGAVNTQVNVGIGVNTNSASGGTFEDRLREINKKRASSPQLLVADTEVETVAEESAADGDPDREDETERPVSQ